MQHALLLSLVAMLFYATEIVVTDLKLSRVTPRLLTVLYSGGVLICALIHLLWSRQEIKMPEGREWWFVLLMILASFIAASAHFAALNQRATATVMCTFYMLLPVAASLLVFLFARRGLPSWKMMAAWILAAAAVYLVVSEQKNDV